MATISEQFIAYANISKQLDLYNRTLKNTMKVNIPTYDFSGITQSLEPFKEHLNLISNQCALISSSIQPLQDYMNSINEMINKSLEAAMPKFNFEYLNNLKIISSYTSDTLESIDSSLFINTVDEIYDSIENLESTNNSVTDLNEFKKIFLDLKQNIKSYSLTKEDFYFFIGILMTLFTIIQPYLDNSTETIIDNQKTIIELKKEQLEVNKDIRDSLENIQNSSINADVIIENINNSLDTFIKSVKE